MVFTRISRAEIDAVRQDVSIGFHLTDANRAIFNIFICDILADITG